MTTQTTFGFALEYVDDIESTKRFYVNSLGMTVEREHTTFVQFTGNGGKFAIATDESMSDRTQRELYWLVDDAERAFRELSQTAEVTMSLTDTAFGKVFGIRDPAGHPCYLLELARHRPSTAVS